MPGAWLKDLRKKARLSQIELGEKAGLDQATISKIERGERQLTDEHAERVAPWLHVSPGELIRRRNAELDIITARPAVLSVDPRVSLPNKLVRFEGLVGAGFVDSSEPYDVGDDIEIPYVPGAYAEADQFAYRVVGNSMNAKRIWDGDYVVCAPYWVARTGAATGDIVVLKRERGQLVEWLVREIKVGPGHYEFWPRSTDPRYNSPIVVQRRDLSDLVEEDGETAITLIGLVIWISVPV